MEPSFPEKLGFVNASYNSPYGKIASSWKRDGDSLEWNITVPANTTATVVLPARFGIKPEPNSDGIHSVIEADGKVIIELGSGNYLLK
jgi:alpha-L-rhamnosidase